MAVDDPLDFTPYSTMSTIQTKSETLNVIITSLLTVLILANLGSAISKSVYFTRRMTFDCNAWLRAFIFANSDDPLRILSWLLRKYDYRDPKWVREKNHLRPSRLIFPLLARGLILLASIASVALSIPGEKRLHACSKHDYALTINPADAKNSIGIAFPTDTCFDVPLSSGLGSIRFSASYCYHLWYRRLSSDDNVNKTERTALAVYKSSRYGYFYTSVAHGEDRWDLHMHVEWEDLTTEGVTYFSNTDSLDLENLLDVAIAAMASRNGNCKVINEPEYSSEGDGAETLTVTLENCVLAGSEHFTSETSYKMEPYIRNALGWKPTAGNDRRIKIDRIAHRLSDDLSCPFQVIVNRPIANIVPLTIILVLWCVANILISYLVNKRGHNVLDATFHLIKEGLGHDCTSNPLEENISRYEVTTLRLYKWVCSSSGGGGHVGYLGREGDHPVDEFDQNTIVGGCGRTKTELENIIVLTGHRQRRIYDQRSTSGDAGQTVRPEASPVAPSISTSGPHHRGDSYVTATPSANATYPTVPVQQGPMPLSHQYVGLTPAAYQYRPADHQYAPVPHGGGYQPQG